MMLFGAIASLVIFLGCGAFLFTIWEVIIFIIIIIIIIIMDIKIIIHIKIIIMIKIMMLIIIKQKSGLEFL